MHGRRALVAVELRLLRARAHAGELMRRTEARLGHDTYDVWVGAQCAPEIVERLAAMAADAYVFLVDSVILSKHAAEIVERLRQRSTVHLRVLAIHERAKTLGLVHDILEWALESGISRRSCIVSFGGGATANVAGLVAALAFRGIRLVHLPTTLVAAADGVLSMKQAVNALVGKNLIGAFHCPSQVLVDVAWLRTLSDREVRSGLCEIVKNALVVEPDGCQRLRERLRNGIALDDADLAAIVEQGIAAKIAVLANDPEERCQGLIFEYGHTLGHAVEIASAGSLSHGESVAIGMLCAAEIAQDICTLSPAVVEAHVELLRLCGVTAGLVTAVSPEEVLRLVLFDNKRGYLRLPAGQIAMVLLEDLARPRFTGEYPLVGVPLEAITRVVMRGSLVRFGETASQ
jgi:3-dehydroquinate synthetase